MAVLATALDTPFTPAGDWALDVTSGTVAVLRRPTTGGPWVRVGDVVGVLGQDVTNTAPGLAEFQLTAVYGTPTVRAYE